MLPAIYRFWSKAVRGSIFIGVILSPAAAFADSPAGGAADLPRDLSPLGMFNSADIVVKSVLVTLVAASAVTWTIALAKSLELFAVRRSARKAAAALASSATVRQAAGETPARSMGCVFANAALAELSVSEPGFDKGGIKERIASHLHRLELAQTRRVNRGTGILATIGAIAPFVGLFGTVWGIMNSFIGISKAHTTNLAVVAPGIAEALLATACGLVAAIPAVVLYNFLSRNLAAYRAELGDVSAQVQRIVSRDLDRQSAAPATQRLSASLLAAE
jgi:biopolymer transport protein ExbB